MPAFRRRMAGPPRARESGGKDHGQAFRALRGLRAKERSTSDYSLWQGTAKQNRTEQTKAQKQEKHTRTDKALSAEQAADFGMWQQSSAAPAC